MTPICCVNKHKSKLHIKNTSANCQHYGRRDCAIRSTQRDHLNRAWRLEACSDANSWKILDNLMTILRQILRSFVWTSSFVLRAEWRSDGVTYQCHDGRWGNGETSSFIQGERQHPWQGTVYRPTAYDHLSSSSVVSPYNRYCVGGDVKPCSVNHSLWWTGSEMSSDWLNWL